MLRRVDDINKILKFDKILGTGSYGVVKEATHLQFNIACAVKILNKSKIFA